MVINTIIFLVNGEIYSPFHIALMSLTTPKSVGAKYAIQIEIITETIAYLSSTILKCKDQDSFSGFCGSKGFVGGAFEIFSIIFS